MRARWLLLWALVLCGCYQPTKPMCSFRCGTDGLCPDDYTCQADGYCHLNGTNDPCPFPAPSDMGSDAASGATDGGGSD